MRLRPDSTVLYVIDVQERLLPAVPDVDRVISRCGRLAQAAGILGVRSVLSEQYPRGLGHTVPEIGRAHV